MKPFKFFLITDTHYFATKLGCFGEEYKSFMQFEQKCFAETEAINKAAFKWLSEAKDADTVLIAGDLSFNGERESHEGFIRLLKMLKESGKRIFVITAGHDFNEKCFAFNDTGRLEFPGTPREELFDLYFEFGFSDAISVHKESLSYVAQLSEGVRLLALNNDGDSEYKHTYTASQREWINEEMRKGREAGDMMFVMNHYPLLPACPLFGLIGDAVMPDSDNMTTLFADGGVHLGFTGHMHNQSIKLKTTESGNKFYDVCTGSLIGCPAFMRLVEIEDKKTVKIESVPVPDFEWDMEGLTTEEYFRRQFDMMIVTYLDCMANDPERLMRKLRLPQNNILKKVLQAFGKYLDKATLGSVSRLFLVKCDKSIKERPLKDFLKEIVRNVFTGNAPYTEDTPEYKVFMGVIGRFSPILFIVKKKVKLKGKPLDVKAMLRECLGNYGPDEYNTTLILE
ncbi:MAG: metallophosphoesterase [Clostridia bacterium]|nr:metallophosphoesterase [Clostridia bacterium]